MATFDFTNLFIYRWRYVLGYGVVGLALITLLTFAGLYLPGGVSESEMNAVVRSDTLSFSDISTFAITSLPYYLLQSLSIDLFGVHDISIKLPSLLLGFASAIGLIFLLRRWFSRNIAVLGSLIAITTGQFLFVAQNGTPGILFIFWPVMLLLLGTLVTRAKRFRSVWKFLFFVTAALSLYTSLSIYPLIAILLAVLLHPHLRNVVRNLSKQKIISFSIVSLAILSPLIYNVITTPSLIISLLGVPPEFPNLLENIKIVAHQYLDFWRPSSTTLMTPVFGLGSMLLILYGLFRVIKTRSDTQSYLILIWLACLIPVIIINPTFTSVMFVPLVLLLTIGLSRLTNYWYRLFPRNPYARIAGLIPLLLLVLALISSGLDRYANGYYYQPQTVQNFSKDLTLLPNDTKTLVVTSSELPFYKTVERHTDGLSVGTTPTTDTFIATRAAKQAYPGYEIDQIITSVNVNEADRFYLYKKVQQ